MAMSWEIQVSAMDYLSSHENYRSTRALKWTISYLIKGFLLIMERNVNKFWFSQIGTSFLLYLIFSFTNNTHVQGVQFVKKVSAYLLRFSYGKFVETLDEEKVNIYWSCRTRRWIWSEVFCFYNGSTEIVYPLDLNCTEYLLRVLPREIVLMKSSWTLQHSFIFLFFCSWSTSFLVSRNVQWY